MRLLWVMVYFMFYRDDVSTVQYAGNVACSYHFPGEHPERESARGNLSNTLARASCNEMPVDKAFESKPEGASCSCSPGSKWRCTITNLVSAPANMLPLI